MAERERRADAQLRAAEPSGVMATAATPRGADLRPVEQDGDPLRLLFVGHRFPQEPFGVVPLEAMAAHRCRARSRRASATLERLVRERAGSVREGGA